MYLRTFARIPTGALIDAKNAKLELLGFGNESIIEALTKVEEVGQDAVGKFDVGCKLVLAGNVKRGPLKEFQGQTAEITSWEGGLMSVTFESGEYTFDDKEKQIQHFKFFSMVQEDGAASGSAAAPRTEAEGENSRQVAAHETPLPTPQ